ncbi:hypothetical protein V7S43_018549 [Phytophthora oleae]|uniref:Transposase Helix-turn-helix domain-containing protein n=1 Tax=Phytophthora oleae TaxID=2107226 RepID=A0ABD3EQS7_9STRA
MSGDGMLLAVFVVSRTRYLLSTALKDLKQQLYKEQRRKEWECLVRVRHYVTLDCLKHPEDSDWMELWLHGTDENLITKTSLSRSPFTELLDRFSRFYDIPSFNPRGGRPRKLQHHHQVLGMLLCFYVDSMTRSQLCLMFGVPPATLFRVVNDAEAVLSRDLKGFSPARIVWPSPARQRALAKLVEARQPLLKYTWGSWMAKNTEFSSLQIQTYRMLTIAAGSITSS